jgi:hypothetical protein
MRARSRYVVSARLGTAQPTVSFLCMTSESEPASSPKEVVRGATAAHDLMAEPEAVRAGVSPPHQVEVTDEVS